ncbi:MAG: glycoside hydrolase family 3 N-terminal domain-containing protein [Rectinemataceae bacterium]
MTRSARAAGMIMGGVRDQSHLADYARAGIRAYLFPGSLLREPDKLASMVAAARRTAESAGLGPVLVAIGGNGTPAFGLPHFPECPTPLGLASLKSAKASRRAGLLLGYRLAVCGVDMVLAPRLDLASDPKDPTGALEGFGEDSRLAGILGTAYSRGLARMGVAACVGRFPGLGATCYDCYESMALIALPVERLERCEMRPFARVVASGVAAVLVGRVLVPALESEHLPASASARVIEGRLRESLGFRGIVIGDDIGPDEEPGKAAVLGALAGCDLCLYSRPDEALAAAQALEKAAATGELPTVRVEMGRRRLDSLLSGRPKSPPRTGFPSARRLRRARLDIAESISILRGSLVLDGAGRGDFAAIFILVFLPPTDAPDAFESEAVLATLRSELPGAEILGLPAEPESDATDELARFLAPRGRFAEAAILTYDAHFRPAQEGLARLVEEFIPKFRVIAMRDPYDAAFFPSAVGLAAAYGFSEGGAQALGRILSGKSKASGGHPVEVIGLEI